MDREREREREKERERRSELYVTIFNTNNLYTVKLYQVFLSSINHHFYHQSMLIARVLFSLSLSYDPSLSAIDLGKSTIEQQCSHISDECKFLQVSQHLCIHGLEFIEKHCFWVLSLSPACFSWMICKIGGMWPYIYCFVGCCFQDFVQNSQ